MKITTSRKLFTKKTHCKTDWNKRKQLYFHAFLPNTVYYELLSIVIVADQNAAFSKIDSWVCTKHQLMRASAYGTFCLGVEYDVSSARWKVWGFTDKVLYICVKGYNITTIRGIWADIEIHVQTKASVNFINEKSCETIKRTGVQLTGILSWFSSRYNEGKTIQSVSPYGTNCFEISTNSLQRWEIEVFHKWRLLYPVAMIGGIFLFYRANVITRSILFYYMAGISLGTIMAVFLLLFVISKFIPQRGIGYAFMFCGSSIVLYFFQLVKIQLIKGDLADIKIFYGYFIVAAIISFLYCYYRGPIQSDRGLDIMRWCLQSIALAMVYYSIRCENISLTFVLIMITTKWVSFHGVLNFFLKRGWVPYRLQAYFRRPRFISMEEYEKEAKEETARALKELKEYCESPDCNTWKTVSRLKSPKRFASFMSDGMHVTLEEKMEHDETSFDCAAFLTSDEDSETDLVAEEL